MVGNASITMVTSSLEAAQAPFVIVHLNVTLEPTLIPVTVELAEFGVVMVAVPDVTLQVPLPVTGTLPANVVLVTLHRF